MSNLEEKKQFSLRLKKALTDSNYPISPTFLSNEFNMRYSGQPVSVQSANNWILGKAIPNQDKLSLLAMWLNVSNQWLRFGDLDSKQITKSNHLNGDDLNLLKQFKQLNSQQKQIIESLLQEFNQD